MVGYTYEASLTTSSVEASVEITVVVVVVVAVAVEVVVVVVVSVAVPLVHAPPSFRRQFTSFTSSTVEPLTVVDKS